MGFDGQSGRAEAPALRPSHRTLAERAFNELKQAILSGRLTPGQRLRITELAVAYEMSPMPIREAIRQLDAVGLVEQFPHRGARVTNVSLEDLHDLVRARIALEPLAASLAAADFSASAQRLASAALDRYREAIRSDDFAAVTAADRQFHYAIYEAAASPWLVRLINTTWESAERYRRLMIPERRILVEREQEHRAILRACAAGNETQAAELMRQHLQHSANNLSRSMVGRPLYPDREG